MIEKYLGNKIYSMIISEYRIDNINELRLRVNAPIVLDIKGEKYVLHNNYILSNEDIEGIVYRLCDNSMYLINDSLKTGYITIQGGIRVGIAGEVIYEKGEVKTIKNFQSLNIRLPHNIIGCSKVVFDYLHCERMYNTLIISPPAAGKTTFLRDIVRNIYKTYPDNNVLIADERGEITNVVNGIPQIFLGNNVDVYTNCAKSFTYENGIRSMAPDVMIVDEISLNSDIDTIKKAQKSGIKMVATMHAEKIDDIKYLLKEQKIFERYVVLSKSNGVGTIDNVYDEQMRCIYSR